MSNNSSPDERCYIYVGRIGSECVYVGMGTGDRLNHLNSGVSHVYEANKAHFNGVQIEVSKIAWDLARTEALKIEKETIIALQPKWNLTDTLLVSNKRKLRRRLNTVKDLKGKSTELKILELCCDKMSDGYSSTIKTSEFNAATGMVLGVWLSNYQKLKSKHKFVKAIEKVGIATYKFSFLEEFIDDIDNKFRSITKTSKRITND